MNPLVLLAAKLPWPDGMMLVYPVVEDRNIIVVGKTGPLVDGAETTNPLRPVLSFIVSVLVSVLVEAEHAVSVLVVAGGKGELEASASSWPLPLCDGMDIGGLPGSDVAVCMVGAVNINGEECVGREVETAVTCEGIGDTAKLGEENTVFKLVCRGVV